MAPVTARLSAKGGFECLEGGEQGRRPRRLVGPGWDIQGDHGVAELGLVGHPDRRRQVQP